MMCQTALQSDDGQRHVPLISGLDVWECNLCTETNGISYEKKRLVPGRTIPSIKIW